MCCLGRKSCHVVLVATGETQVLQHEFRHITGAAWAANRLFIADVAGIIEYRPTGVSSLRDMAAQAVRRDARVDIAMLPEELRLVVAPREEVQDIIFEGHVLAEKYLDPTPGCDYDDGDDDNDDDEDDNNDDDR